MPDSPPNPRDRRARLAAALESDAGHEPGEIRRTRVLALPHSVQSETNRRDRLGAALTDVDAGVRHAALQVIGYDADRCAHFADSLVAVLSADASAPCREAAAFALGEANKDRVQALLHALRADGSAMVRESVVAALGALGASSVVAGADVARVVDAVVRAAGRDKPAVRRRAVVALAAFDAPAAHAAIDAARADRDRYVREAAEWILRED